MVTPEAGNKGQDSKVRFKDRQYEPDRKRLSRSIPTKNSPRGEEIDLQETSSKESSKNSTPVPGGGKERKKPSVKSEDMQAEPKPRKLPSLFKGGKKPLKPSKSRKGKKIKLPEVSSTDQKTWGKWGKPLSASRMESPSCKDDSSMRWPFVDQQDMRLDKTAVPNITNPSSDPKFSELSASFQLMSSFADLYGSTNTMDVIASLELQHKRRKQEHIESELKAIEERIYKTLEEVGMEDGVKPEGEPIKTVFDAVAENKKVHDRITFLGLLDAFEDKTVTRNQSLLELSYWFEDHLNMCADLGTLEELKEAMLTTKKIHKVLCSSLESFIDTGEEVVEKGKMLLEETSKIIKERNALMSKSINRGKIVVIDDKALGDDASKWESAASTILSVFEDSYKMIKNFSFRNDIRLTIKQFEFMNDAIKRKLKELEEKKQQCLELKEQVNSLKMKCERLNRDVEGEKNASRRIGTELVEAKAEMVTLNLKIRELQQKVAELTAQIKLLTEELQLKSREPTLHTPPPPKPQTPKLYEAPKSEPEKVVVKVKDQGVEKQLREVEKELRNAKAEIEALVSKLSSVKEQLMQEQQLLRLHQDRVWELENKLESMEKVQESAWPDPFMTPSPPRTPSPVQEPPPEIPEPEVNKSPEVRRTSDARRTSEVPTDKDAAYFKKLMTVMKLEHQTEVEKVMSRVRKEKAMGEAGIKRMEMLHKNQLVNIQKDVLRMLRGIMHFRDHMKTCLEEENLLDQCQALHELGDIVNEKKSLEPNVMLAAIVGTVIDYLHKMEGIVTNSFLAMRVMMKHQIDRYVNMEMQQRMTIQHHKKEAAGATTAVKGLANSLEKDKTKLVQKTKTKDVVSDKKYQELMSRYSAMMRVYNKLQREMKILQADFRDTLQKKMELKESMQVSQVSGELKQKQRLAEEQQRMSIADQKENLRLLCRAYEDNKISKALHRRATIMIQTTLEIPRKKLRNLFEQYIAFRAVKDSKARVARVLEEEKYELPAHVFIDMERYLDSMDDRLRTNMETRQAEMRTLEAEKKDLHNKIYNMFNEVLVATGVRFIHPALPEKSNMMNMTQAASRLNREKLKEIILNKKRCKELLALPESLFGTSVLHGQGDMLSGGRRSYRIPGDMQKLPSIWMRQHQEQSDWSWDSKRYDHAGVTTPHLLAYDINKPKLTALRSMYNRRERYTIGRTESFDISNGTYVHYIRDLANPANSPEPVWQPV